MLANGERSKVCDVTGSELLFAASRQHPFGFHLVLEVAMVAVKGQVLNYTKVYILSSKFCFVN